MLQKLQKEIHWLTATGIITGLSLVAAVSITIHTSVAYSATGFGGIVTYYQPACNWDAAAATCGTCPLCSGILGPACAGVQEVRFIPLGPSAITFICPAKGYKFEGGKGFPTPGGFLLGTGNNPVKPERVGVSP